MSQQHISVLLVEDGAIALFAEKMKLERMGCTVDLAATGEEALELCKKNNYRLILMDLDLGETMNGFMVTQQIREQVKEIPPIIVALTSQEDESHKARATQSGMDYFLRKPLTDDMVKNIFDNYFPQSD